MILYMEYEGIFTKTFKECLKKHPDKKKRIKVLVDKILTNPFHQSHLLKKLKGVDLRGKRRRHLTGNFVIIYTVCDECIKLNFQQSNNCINCNRQPKKRVIFIAFGTHKDIYAREWLGELDKTSLTFSPNPELNPNKNP